MGKEGTSSLPSWAHHAVDAGCSVQCTCTVHFRSYGYLSDCIKSSLEPIGAVLPWFVDTTVRALHAFE